MSSSRKKKDDSLTSGEIRSTSTRKRTTKSHTVIRRTDSDSDDTEQSHISDFSSDPDEGQRHHRSHIRSSSQNVTVMVPVVETIDRIEGIVTSIKEIIKHGSEFSNVSAVRAAGELKAVTHELKAVAKRRNDAPQAADAMAPMLANLQRDVAVAVKMLRNIQVPAPAPAPAPTPTVIHTDSAIVEALEKQRKQVQELKTTAATQQDEFNKQVAQIETALKNVNLSGHVIHTSNEVTFERAIERIACETETQLAKIDQSLKAGTVSDALRHQLMAIRSDIQALVVPATTADLQAAVGLLEIGLKGIDQCIKALADAPRAPDNTERITDMVCNAEMRITAAIGNIQIAGTAAPAPAVQHVTQQQDPVIVN
jgi:Tfp pilus assembly protein PilV